VGRLGAVTTDPPPTWAELDAYRRGCLADGYHPNTVRQDLVLLLVAWNYGRGHRYVPDVPLARVVVAAPARDPYTPTPLEIARLVARLGTWHTEGRIRAVDGRRIYAPAWVPLAARLYWATGARRSEIAHLQIGDVRLLEDGTAEVQLGLHTHSQKTGPRTVPVADAATVAALATWLQSRPEVASLPFWGRSPRCVEELYDWMHRACDEEGLRHFTAQAVRRAVTDSLYDAGVDPKVEARLLGHSDATAMRFYRQPRPSAMAAAVRKAGLGALDLPAGEVIHLERRKG
jgi:integrase